MSIADLYADAEWERVAERIKTWPGAAKLTRADVDAYMTVFRRPYGRDTPRCDPIELERLIDDLIAQDVRGARATPAAMLEALRIRRRAHVSRVDEGVIRYADSFEGEPPNAQDTAHASARGLSLAGLMRAVRSKHGLDPWPEHLPGECPQCAQELAVRALEGRLEAELGSGYKRLPQYARELETLEAELAERFPTYYLTPEERAEKGGDA